MGPGCWKIRKTHKQSGFELILFNNRNKFIFYKLKLFTALFFHDTAPSGELKKFLNKSLVSRAVWDERLPACCAIEGRC